MIIHFQNILVLKEFIACNGCFRSFTKIKKGSGTSFWCTFSKWFVHKNVPYLILYRWIKFQCHTFFDSQDIKQKFIFRQMMTCKLEDLSWIKLWGNDWQGEKEGKMEKQKFEYLKNKKSFLDEIENMFHSFWRAIIWWKIKIC